MEIFLLLGLLGLALLAWPFLRQRLKKTPPRLNGPALADLQYTEITFKNQGLTLAGLLFLPPQATGPVPVMVFIHGSGTSRRNSAWYLTVAHHLQAQGIAVVLPDKRGSEKSAGQWQHATLHDLAADAGAAIDFVKQQTQFAYTKIGILGFSQGGWITPLVATTCPAVALVANLSGAGVTTDEQLLHEEEHRILDFGTYRFLAQRLAPWTVRQLQKRPFWKMIGGFDPLPYWQKVTVPVFWAFGEGDKNVPVAESVRRLRAIQQPNWWLKVYPAGGHGIVTRATGRVQAEYLQDLTTFIHTAQIAG